MYPALWTFLFLGLAFVVAVLEVFLPTGGLLAGLAIALLIASIVFAFQFHVVFGSLYTLFVCLLIPVFIWGALRFWPRTWIGRQILLAPENDPALIPNAEQEMLKQLIGKQGLAKSTMLLGGHIEIEGVRYSAVSDAEPMASGDPVSVIRIEGTCLIVRKLNLNKNTAASPTAETSLEDPFI